MTVVSVLDGQREELQFKDAVTELSLSATHLIVVTATLFSRPARAASPSSTMITVVCSNLYPRVVAGILD